jgi:segregation and condensation protein B
MTDYKNQIEAILFASGRLMGVDTLINLTGASSRKVVENAIKKLIEEYKGRDSPLMIVEEKDGWKLTVQEAYLPLVRKIISDMELPKSLLETLAVIAWKAPVLQSEVIDIRHNKAYDHIKELEELGFIGKEVQGRSYLIKLSTKFFEYFDIEGKKDIKEIFKTIKETALQRKAGDTGGLEVYEAKEKPEVPIPTDAEHLGRLEVYEEGEAKSTEGEFKREEEHKQVTSDGEFAEQKALSDESGAKAEEAIATPQAMGEKSKSKKEDKAEDVIEEMEDIHKSLEKNLEEDEPDKLEKIESLEKHPRSKVAEEDLYGEDESKQ